MPRCCDNCIYIYPCGNCIFFLFLWREVGIYVPSILVLFLLTSASCPLQTFESSMYRGSKETRMRIVFQYMVW